MSDLTRLPAPDGVAPRAGYSHVAWGEGRTVAVSGQLPLDEHGELVGDGDPAAQARQVFANLGRCLEAAGAAVEDVLRLTCFTTDLGILPAVRAARDAWARAAGADTAAPPAGTAVQVTALAHPGALLAVEAYAVVGG